MKRNIKIILISLVVIFAGMQFIRPAKNEKVANPKNDIIFHLQIPELVKKKIVDACYDCHSERTRYPIYNQIAPVSWILANDIKRAKEHLNFSAWATYDKKEQLKLLSDICDEITDGEMPLKSYRFMHSDAVLDPGQVDAICKWTEDAGDELLSKKE